MIVRPTVMIDAGCSAREAAHGACRCERQALFDVSLHEAQLRRLLEEPLTRPLGSLFSACRWAPRETESFADEVTLVRHASKRERLDELRSSAQPSSPEAARWPLTAAAPGRSAARAGTCMLGTASSPRRTTRMSTPDAPPRSSALFAGIVDGWERLPSQAKPKLARGSWGRAAEWHHVWATAAVLGVFAMVLAFALTLHLAAGHAPRARQDATATR